MKINFSNLSTPLKTAVVFAWILGVFNTLVVLVTVIEEILLL